VAVLSAAALLAAPTGSGGSGRSAKAASEPAVVVRDFRFLGLGRDVVGPDEVRPNGERDAHFSVVVATPGGARLLSSVSLWQMGPFSGTPHFNPVNPKIGPRFTTVGVFRAGRPLHLDGRAKGTWVALPRSVAGVRLDLYVNDGPACLPGPEAPETVSCRSTRLGTDHRFGPGLRFRLKVTTAAPGAARTTATASPWLTLPGQQPKKGTGVVLSNFRFLGLDRDVAGPTYGSPPDGVPDAHFSLDLAPTGPGYLTLFHLRKQTEGGPLGWGTIGESPALTAFLDGTPLPLRCCSAESVEDDWKTWVELRWLGKPMHVDLYAHPYTEFAPGSRFTILAGVTLAFRGEITPTIEGGTEATLTLPDS